VAEVDFRRGVRGCGALTGEGIARNAGDGGEPVAEPRSDAAFMSPQPDLNTHWRRHSPLKPILAKLPELLFATSGSQLRLANSPTRGEYLTCAGEKYKTASPELWPILLWSSQRRKANRKDHPLRALAEQVSSRYFTLTIGYAGPCRC